MSTDKQVATATGSVYGGGQTRKRVQDATFAGRVGGNQEFIADSDDTSLLRKQPDAAPLQSLSAIFQLESFVDGDLWRMACLEGIGTMLITFLLSGPAIGLTTMNQSIFAKTLYAALTNFLGLSIFIFCLAPVSGGHLNPSISLATFFAGLSTFPRTVLYVGAQSVGAIVAGYLLKLGTGPNYFPEGVIPSCTVDTAEISVGQMFVLEFVFGFAGLFMAFGVGLEPRQAKIYGPAFAPVLVGVTLGLTTLCSAIISPGYTGASLNPARCLGLMTAQGDLRRHWLHWIGSLTAAAVNGLLYQMAPPWRRDDSLLNQSVARISQLFRTREHRNRV